MSNSSSNGAKNLRRALSKTGALIRGRMGAIQWLIMCGAALVLVIALGTAYLANTALLLSRHFDQQLSDLQHVHEDILNYVRAGGIDTAESFERRMSLLATHEMLRTRLAALPYVGALNVFNKDGWLINSSEVWPVPDVHIRDRRTFRTFTAEGPAPEVIVEPVISKVTGVWTTVFARKIVDSKGDIIGFASRLRAILRISRSWARTSHRCRSSSAPWRLVETSPAASSARLRQTIVSERCVHSIIFRS